MLIVNLERVLELAGLHEGIGKSGNGAKVVVDGEELAGQSAGIGEAASLQVSLKQVAEAIRIGIEIGDFLERFDGGFGVAGLKLVAALHEQRVAIAGIEGEHALQNFFGGAGGTLGTQSFGAAEKICQASFFLPRRT